MDISLREQRRAGNAEVSRHGLSTVAELRRWKDNPPAWLHNVEFERPDAKATILDAPEVESVKSPAPRIPKDLPRYLRSLYLTPLLSRELERDLFRRYNFSKFLFAGLLASIDPESVTKRDIARLQSLKRSIDDYRHRITRANLRLVVSIAKRHVGRAANFFEVVSDGNMSLIQAIEKFDYSRGTKFSTYATWAIMKNYARLIPESHSHSSRFVTGQDLTMEQTVDPRVMTSWESDRHEVREIIESRLIELSKREREILRGRFGLGDANEQPVTLERLGRRFGMTKERVRQIERRAIARLRQTLPSRLVESI